MSNEKLPNPREIGNSMNIREYFCDDDYDYNVLGLMFGQLIAHDVSQKRPYAITGT